MPKYLTIKFDPPPAHLSVLRREQAQQAHLFFLPCLNSQTKYLSLAGWGTGTGAAGLSPAWQRWRPAPRALRSATCAAAAARGRGEPGPGRSCRRGRGPSPPREPPPGTGEHPRPLRGSAHLPGSCLQPCRSSPRRGRGGEMRLAD